MQVETRLASAVTQSNAAGAMRPAKTLVLLGLLLAGDVFHAPRPLAGQQILPALIGGATGLAAGGYVAIGIVTFQARRGRYLYSSEDALGWHATPILVGPSVGFLIGLFDQERLRRTVVGGAVGGFVSTGVGMVIGDYVWAPPEGRWAGAVIGSAAGLLAGSLIGAVWPAPDDPEPEAPLASRSIPIGLTIRF
jgi:hypothetical protein